ncbi:nonstructural protein [Sigmofec virus UA08Rod_5448]|uniref:Nonstructural protein n=1 Tax=Sigmofec virus UA08Rod_5448 TaxID=2929425 RepID=A0A976N1N1_9VIRU|nr:nonstructural protein [Sigmofec virus UA08Rod_5448]
MTYGLFAMRDARTGFTSVTVDQNDASAVRNFFFAVQHSDTVMTAFAREFSLYRLADFDSDSGVITPLSPIVFLANGDDAFKDGDK